jgi:purine nucleoside permease
MQALTFLSHAGRVSLNRVLVLRSASDYTLPPPGTAAAAFLAHETHDGFPANAEALDALYRVAAPVARRLADRWDETRDRVPGGDPSTPSAPGR